MIDFHRKIGGCEQSTLDLDGFWHFAWNTPSETKNPEFTPLSETTNILAANFQMGDLAPGVRMWFLDYNLHLLPSSIHFTLSSKEVSS